MSLCSYCSRRYCTIPSTSTSTTVISDAFIRLCSLLNLAFERMISVARYAAKRHNPVLKATGLLSVEELDKITMHIHKSTKPSEDVVKALLEVSSKSLLSESHCISWDRSNEKRAKTFIFANMDISYAKLLQLTSSNALQLPSQDNQFVFLSPRVDPSSDESLKGLLTLLTWRLLFPQSVCLLRSSPIGETAVSSELQVETASWEPEFLKLKNALPISLVLDKSIFIVNGGISQETSAMTIDEIRNLSPSDPENHMILNEFILAAPSKRKKQETDEIIFKTEQVNEFLDLNQLELMVRCDALSEDPFPTTRKRCYSFNGCAVPADRKVPPISLNAGFNQSCLLYSRPHNKTQTFKVLNL